MRERFREIAQKACFRARERYHSLSASPIRKFWWSLQGMRIGSGTNLPKIAVTWPHQVSIGRHCIVEEDVFFKFDGIWACGPRIVIGNNVFIGKSCEFNIRRSIEIGEDSLIASGCKFIDHDHGIKLGAPMRSQHNVEAPIQIGKDVWIGVNVIVLKGVSLGDSCIIAAGAVVTKPVSSLEIWAGIPARKIGMRSQ